MGRSGAERFIAKALPGQDGSDMGRGPGLRTSSRLMQSGCAALFLQGFPPGWTDTYYTQICGNFLAPAQGRVRVRWKPAVFGGSALQRAPEKAASTQQRTRMGPKQNGAQTENPTQRMLSGVDGALGRIRTPDLRNRNPTLSPTELRAHGGPLSMPISFPM